MHSDQTRKDGSSESMIQALYYDFVANYVKTRMYSTRYVQCNSGGQSSADRGATESGSAEVLSSLVPRPSGGRPGTHSARMRVIIAKFT